MSESDIQSIMQYGGPAALLIFLLLAGITVLWKHHLSQMKLWTENQLADNKAMIEVTERSTNAINTLTELLRNSSVSNAAYQSEMRNKIDAAIGQLQEFRVEFMARNGGRRR